MRRLSSVLVFALALGSGVARADQPGYGCVGAPVFANTHYAPALIPIGVVTPPSTTLHTGCGGAYSASFRNPQPGELSLVVLELPACSRGICAGLTRGAALDCQMTIGYCCEMSRGHALSVHLPELLGALVLRDTRWDSDSDQRQEICLEQYTGNGNRLVRLPLVTLEPGNGMARAFGSMTAFIVSIGVGGDPGRARIEFLSRAEDGSPRP